MELGEIGSQNSSRKRAPKACRRCRRQKIRCTGSRPCEPCSKRNLTCHFDDYAQKILVTRGYIRDLEKRIESFERQGQDFDPSTGIADEPTDPDRDLELEVDDEDDVLEDNIARNVPELEEAAPQQVERSVPAIPPRLPEEQQSRSSSEAAQLMNPLALGLSSYFPDTNGRPIYLGTSSNWSFGRRVLAMVHERVIRAPLPSENLLFEGKSYDLGWDGKRSLSMVPQTDVPVLPSADFAMYLINAVKFHCGQLFHLFEEERFMEQFSLFQENPTQASQFPNLWYTHYLLILAFGKAFVAQGNKGGKPPGAELFVYAIKIMPDFGFYHADPIESIQVLCCASLYLQCLDFRGAAYRTIGQALRMALENGMHTEMHSAEVDRALAERCRRVWWTVYILDRQMSSLMGVPMSVADDAISAELPTFAGHPQRSTAVYLQIKLSRTLGQILNIYGMEGRLDKRFLHITKEALKNVANVTDQLNSSFSIPGDGSKASISRLSAHLHLLYHQCIVVTTRPLLYSFLQARLGQSDVNRIESIKSKSVRILLQMCVESAQQMLIILSALQGHSLLESFLPFDLDAAFTSSIALLMATIVDSSLTNSHPPWSSRSYTILDEIISRGNTVARLIKLELQQLEEILKRLPLNGTARDGTVDRASNIHGSLMLDERQSRHLGPQAPPPLLSSPPYMPTSQPVLDEFSVEDFNWQDGFTAGQLMNFADSMDVHALDWLSAGVE